jgi:hypothetical protein
MAEYRVPDWIRRQFFDSGGDDLNPHCCPQENKPVVEPKLDGYAEQVKKDLAGLRCGWLRFIVLLCRWTTAN